MACAPAVRHRTGLLAIGDVALACAVAAEHRREAFVACTDPRGQPEGTTAPLEAPSFTAGTDE
jgi:hypothetical protein